MNWCLTWKLGYVGKGRIERMGAAPPVVEWRSAVSRGVISQDGRAGTGVAKGVNPLIC